MGRWTWIVHCFTCFAVSVSLLSGQKWIHPFLMQFCTTRDVNLGEAHSAGCLSLYTCMIRMQVAWYRLLSMAKNTARKTQLEFCTMGLVIMMHWRFLEGRVLSQDCSISFKMLKRLKPVLIPFNDIYNVMYRSSFPKYNLLGLGGHMIQGPNEQWYSLYCCSIHSLHLSFYDVIFIVLKKEESPWHQVGLVQTIHQLLWALSVKDRNNGLTFCLIPPLRRCTSILVSSLLPLRNRYVMSKKAVSHWEIH